MLALLGFIGVWTLAKKRRRQNKLQITLLFNVSKKKKKKHYSLIITIIQKYFVIIQTFYIYTYQKNIIYILHYFRSWFA